MVNWHTEYNEAQMENLKIVEDRLSIKFPRDYLECVLKYQGGRPSLSNIMVDENTIVQFRYLLSFLVFDELDILDTYNSIREYIPFGIVPFGLGSDNYLFCFDFRLNDTPTILICRPSDTCETKIVNVCDTFSELIMKLY